jgi:23S rRNA (guanosine2251-2'-O)-methyltransferase
MARGSTDKFSRKKGAGQRKSGAEKPGRAKREDDKARKAAPQKPPAPPRPRQTKYDDRLKLKGEAVYGLHAVRAAWLNPQRQIHAFYVAGGVPGVMADAIAQASAAGLTRPQPVIVDKDRLSRHVQGAVHQGVLLDAGDLPETGVHDLVNAVHARDAACFVLLDQVTDPHNVGAIMRSASAFGMDGIIMQQRNAPRLSGALTKTACGAAEYLPAAFETNLSRTIDVLKEAGFTIIGMDEHSNADFSALSGASGRNVIVLGAEGTGMRRLVREHCDVLVRLPTSGPIQSLNVSNAAAIAFYALAKS